MEQLIYALILASAAALGLAGAAILRRRPVQRRLARLADGSRPMIQAAPGDTLLADDRGGFLSRLVAPLAGRAAREQGRTHPLRRRLVQAGYRGPSAVAAYTGTRVALGLLLPALVALHPGVWALTQLQLVALLLMVAGIGLVLPGWWVDRRRRSRQRALTIGLPDALDLMVVCVEAGLGINASLGRVAEEFRRSNPVLAAEFELTTMEIRAGKSTAESLRDMAERTGVGSVSVLVAMLIQTERFGTSLGDTLRVHADAMRVERLQRAEELAAKAPLRMLFPTVLIFVATLMVTIGPGMIQLFGFFGEER